MPILDLCTQIEYHEHVLYDEGLFVNLYCD